MKKCSNCKIEYENDVNFCKKCGSLLEFFETESEKSIKEISPNEKQKKGNLVRYILGAIIILGNINNISEFKLYGFMGILFGISLLPISYQIFFKNKKIMDNNFVKRVKKLIPIITPIIFGFLWMISSPGEQLEFINIFDEGNIIAINENYEIDFSTNLTKKNKEDFEYISSNPEIATVENGIIKGKKEGKVVITIKGDNSVEQTAEYQIQYVDIEQLSIVGNTKLAIGQINKLNTTSIPEKTSDYVVKWESSNTEVISIDNKGNMTANSIGSSTITATTEKGKTAHINVGVYANVDFIEIIEKVAKVAIGKNITFKLNISPESANVEGISWFSEDEDIAKVENGVVTGISEGNTTIIAKSVNGLEATATIEVYEVKPESVSLNKTSISLSVNQTSKITATINPSNSSNKSIYWSSTNSSVASVENGVITANERGTATITAKTSNGKSATVSVTVTEKAPIKLSRFKWIKDSVCGIEWNLSITNNSSKTINYVTLKWYTLNAVGDFVYDQISGKNYVQLRYTGPLKPKKNSGKFVNITRFYNCAYANSILSEIKIDYEDGTSKTILNSEFNQYTGLQ